MSPAQEHRRFNYQALGKAPCRVAQPTGKTRQLALNTPTLS